MSRVWIAFLCVVAVSCKTYDQQMEPVHREFYDNSPDKAVELIEGYLDPGFWNFGAPGEEDHALLTLEMASAMQAGEKYAKAAEELQEVDQHLEVLDYTNMPVKEIASFMFATDKPWRATPPERLLVNTQGMLNRLAQRKNPDYLEDAAVEAARVRTLLTQGDVPEEELFANAFVNGLAGFCMEQRGRTGEAQDFWNRVQGFNPMAPVAPAEGSPETGTVLVVVQMGKAPIRRQYRVALPVDGQIYQLRIPVMAERPDSYDRAQVVVDGVEQGSTYMMFDLGEHLMEQYKRDRPRLLAAAATQLATRAFISKSVGAASDSSKGNSDTARFMEFITSIFLAEMQPPDTRCWSLVPQSFHVMRLDLPVGEHEISVVLDGSKHRDLAPLVVDVQPRRPYLINIVSDCFRTWSEKEEKRELMPEDASAEQVAQWEGIEEAEAEARIALKSAQ